MRTMHCPARSDGTFRRHVDINILVYLTLCTMHCCNENGNVLHCIYIRYNLHNLSVHFHCLNFSVRSSERELLSETQAWGGVEIKKKNDEQTENVGSCLTFSTPEETRCTRLCSGQQRYLIIFTLEFTFGIADSGAGLCYYYHCRMVCEDSKRTMSTMERQQWMEQMRTSTRSTEGIHLIFFAITSSFQTSNYWNWMSNIERTTNIQYTFWPLCSIQPTNTQSGW